MCNLDVNDKAMIRNMCLSKEIELKRIQRLLPTNTNERNIARVRAIRAKVS
jgi:hypothetical protein